MAKAIKKTKEVKQKTEFKKPRRTYCNGIFLGFKRCRVVQHMRTALIQIEGLDCKKDVDYYLGNEVNYIIKKKGAKPNRELQGKIVRAHGNSGIVRARFKKNMPPCAIGKRVRVMLYKSDLDL